MWTHVGLAIILDSMVTKSDSFGDLRPASHRYGLLFIRLGHKLDPVFLSSSPYFTLVWNGTQIFHSHPYQCHFHRRLTASPYLRSNFTSHENFETTKIIIPAHMLIATTCGTSRQHNYAMYCTTVPYWHVIVYNNSNPLDCETI